MKKREPLSKKLKTIGGRMWLYRESVAQVKGKAMAALLGISAGAYSDLESSKKQPSANVFVGYCAQPRMDMHWLLTGEIQTETAKEIYRRITGNYDFGIEEEVEEVEVLVLWKEHMVGNKEIDNGRKYLVSLMNTIKAAVDSGLGVEVAINHVAELYNYAEEYFKIEEAIQKSIEFEGRTKHKEMHKRLIDDLHTKHQYVVSAGEGDHQDLALENISEPLANLLFRHLEEDLKMRGYFID
jgi:hemerythrin-like metal-binding protein